MQNESDREKDQQRLYKVGISGSYGGLNLGDEAILQVIVSELRRTLSVEITVFSRDAEDTRSRHDVEHVVQSRVQSRRDTKEVIANLDLFILGGGGILYDGEADMYLREALLANDSGVPVMVYSISAGPLVDAPLRNRVRDALNQTRLITVRDRNARQLLEDIGVRQEITLTADPAMLLEPEPLTLDEILRTEAINTEKRLIGFSVREPGPAAPRLDVDHYHRLLANVADFMVDRLNAEIVFFPMERRMSDVQHSHSVVGQMSHAQCATVLKGDYRPGQLLSLLEHFDFAVGMRLHFLVFSALANVPFVGLPYAAKVSGFLDEFRLQAPLLEKHVSAGQLIAHIDRAWHQRDEICTHLKQTLPELKQRAQLANHLAVSLLHQLETPQSKDSESKSA